MKKRKKRTIPKNTKIPKLTREDGQSEKLEEKKINAEEGFKPLFSKDVNDPSERGYDQMHKHIFPIISLICLNIAIFLLLYEYFQKGIVTRDVWLTLLLMVSVFMINIPYWKDYFKK